MSEIAVDPSVSVRLSTRLEAEADRFLEENFVDPPMQMKYIIRSAFLRGALNASENAIDVVKLTR